jgi:hypothetical protein
VLTISLVSLYAIVAGPPAYVVDATPKGQVLKERRVGLFVRFAELLVCLIVVFVIGAVLGWW